MEKEVKILISEDDNGHFILLRHRLRHSGIDNEIIHFSDGQETLDFLNENSSESGMNADKRYLMLLDIRMPKVDGLEVLKTVKQDQRFQDIPVIMVTSSDDPDNIRRCRQLGSDGYIVKPLDQKAVDTIKNYCNSNHVAS